MRTKQVKTPRLSSNENTRIPSHTNVIEPFSHKHIDHPLQLSPLHKFTECLPSNS